MEETIELRQIINILLKGKWIVAICTIAAILVAAIVSFFVETESYSSSATVQIIKTNPTEKEIEDVMTEFIMTEFTPTVYIQRLQQNSAGLVSASNDTDTDLITLTATDVSAIKAQELLQKVVKETKQDFTVSITDSLTKMSDEYYKESEKLTVEIEELILRYNDIVRENSLPGILLLQTMLTDDISLALTNEQLAPLNKIDGTLQNELLQLKAQIDIKSEQYRKVLANYHSFKLGKDSFQVEQYIRTIVEPNLPSGASSPNKKLNLLIGLVIGLMVGMGIVLFREYWKATAK